jgi:hypothetical protein
MPSSGSSASIQKHQWTDAYGKPIECIHRYGCEIVGLSHSNKRGRDRMEFIKHLTIGTKVVLFPEPNNRVDRNAILVYLQGDFENDIGYLYSSGAKRICRMMECGATFSAQVYWINSNPRRQYPEVFLYIYQLTPTTLTRRPTRKGAPEYRRTPRTALTNKRRETVELALSEHNQQEQVGIWTRIKRLFLLG